MNVPAHERFDPHIHRADVAAALLEEAARRHRGKLCASHFRKLSGGFQNSNYLVQQGSQKFVLRFCSQGADTARREGALLEFLSTREVRSPRLLNLLEWDGNVVAVHEFLEGHTLQEALTKPLPRDLFRQVGEELAKVHRIEFSTGGFVELPQSGFIGQHIAIGGQYESFSLFLREFIFKTLREIAEDRLDFDVRDRLMKLVEDKWHFVIATEPLRQLVHSDFNPKNVMVSLDGGSVTGILDWEFCLSGNGYVDIGNFFRFAEDYPEGTSEAFREGYEAGRGTIAKDWRDISRLMDLGNMCSFLERRENYQKTFRTARSVIEATLTHFGY